MSFKKMLESSGYREVTPGWFRFPGGGQGTYPCAVSQMAGSYPKLPSIPWKEAEDMISAVKGTRLDCVLPITEEAFRPGIQAALGLPSGEIQLNSRSWQAASAMLDVAAFGDEFNRRKAILQKAHPAFENLPCHVGSAACQVPHQVWQGAILMGPCVSFKVPLDVPQMRRWAARGAGVISLKSGWAWIIPGQSEIFTVSIYDEYSRFTPRAWDVERILGEVTLIEKAPPLEATTIW